MEDGRQGLGKRLVEGEADPFGKAGLEVEVAVGGGVLVVEVHATRYGFVVLQPGAGVVENDAVVVDFLFGEGVVAPDGFGCVEGDDVAHVELGYAGHHAGALHISYHFAFEGKVVDTFFASAKEERDEQEQDDFFHGKRSLGVIH